MLDRTTAWSCAVTAADASAAAAAAAGGRYTVSTDAIQCMTDAVRSQFTLFSTRKHDVNTVRCHVSYFLLLYDFFPLYFVV